LRRLQPISRLFGLDRGLPIDRYYIERFLSGQELDIKGCVLEIGDDSYTRKFGGDRVSKSEVLHIEEGNPKATIVADLTRADHIASETFDCIIFTQTLQVIYDVRAATYTLNRILKPGGVLLATFSGISQISRYDMDRWGDYWRFTDASARQLFGQVFGPENVTITTDGNVLAACSYLHGLAAHELDQSELDYHDPDYQVLIKIRATKV
jgi:SAM-dependent methyltransferase